MNDITTSADRGAGVGQTLPIPPIGIAVVGAGYFGGLHARCYARLAGARLLALVDPNPQARALAGQLGVPWLRHVDDLPDTVRAVSIVTPVATHFPLAKTLLRRGFDVLLEKPITETEAQALELRQLAREEKRILQIGHIERFNPAFVGGQELLARAREIQALRTTRRQPRANALDVVIDLMIHDIDLILHGVASELVRIRATGRSHGLTPIDEAQAELHFASGCRALLSVHWGRESATDDRCMIARLSRDETWRLDFYRRTASRQMHPHAVGSVVDVPPLEKPDNLSMQLASFADSVLRRAEPRVTPEDGRRALGVVTEIRKQILGALP